jgi:branched-chain amino acid transport system ATP-binding protein
MLEVRGLDAYYGEARALWEVDLDVGDGEIVCIVGPNGAGKSTLVHAIAGVHRSIGGGLTLDGNDLRSVPRHRVCDLGISIVPEGRRIFPEMSVQDNLDLGAHRRSARADRASTLAEVRTLFPRLEQRAQQLAGTLSGGEQQMLAIGRALMAKPRLLLMDEPSLGLAPVVVDEVFDAIVAINRLGVSVLLVEQDVSRALEIATRGHLLAEGRVVLGGASGELAADDAVRRVVLGV